MKTDSKNVRSILTFTQSAANADVVAYSSLDAFDRNQGFVLRAVEWMLDPSKLYDVAADAWYRLQIFGATSAVPTGEYAIGDKRIIAEHGRAVALTTSGIAVVQADGFWIPPDGVDIVLGCEYLGAIFCSAGLTSAVVGAVNLYGDSVTLTDEERALSQLRFT